MPITGSTLEQALTLNAKRAMLSPVHVIIQTIVIFAILLLFTYLLNKWSLERDADPARGTEPSFDRWRTKFENLSGARNLHLRHPADRQVQSDRIKSHRRHLVHLDLGVCSFLVGQKAMPFLLSVS